MKVYRVIRERLGRAPASIVAAGPKIGLERHTLRILVRYTVTIERRFSACTVVFSSILGSTLCKSTV